MADAEAVFTNTFFTYLFYEYIVGLLVVFTHVQLATLVSDPYCLKDVKFLSLLLIAAVWPFSLFLIFFISLEDALAEQSKEQLVSYERTQKRVRRVLRSRGFLPIGSSRGLACNSVPGHEPGVFRGKRILGLWSHSAIVSEKFLFRDLRR